MSHIMLCVPGMSIFRFSAEFRFFFFFTFRFFKNDFPLFLKNRQKTFFFFSFTDTATLDYSKSFGKQSVTSWFVLLPFPVSVLNSKAPYLHSAVEI